GNSVVHAKSVLIRAGGIHRPRSSNPFASPDSQPARILPDAAERPLGPPIAGAGLLVHGIVSPRSSLPHILVEQDGAGWRILVLGGEDVEEGIVMASRPRGAGDEDLRTVALGPLPDRDRPGAGTVGREEGNLVRAGLGGHVRTDRQPALAEGVDP